MKDNYIFKANTNYEILTPSGFRSFGGVRKLSKGKHYEISFSNGNVLKCSTTHKFISNGIDISIDKLNIGDYVDGVDGDIVNIVNKKLINSDISLFDIVEVDGGNIFNVDGLVSHNCDFVSSGNTVIEPEILVWYKETFVKPPIEKTGMDGNYWKWEYPDYKHSYIVVADVARGDGTDYSTFHVIEIENNIQVAEYRGKIDTTEFGNFLVAVATEWNNALLVIENANIGWATIQQCINRDYQNLYYQSDDPKYVDVERQYSNKIYAAEKKEVAGFTTSIRTRPLILSKLHEYFKSKNMVIQSSRLIDELFTFIWHGNRPEAMRGYNDDLVMALAIALWVRDTALRLRSEKVNLAKQSLNSITMTGISMGNTRKYGYNDPADPYKIRLNDSTNEDIKWLL